MERFLWGIYPYLAAVLFFGVPVLRMAHRPFSWSTRASGFVAREAMGIASLALHWGLFLLLAGHVAGLVGGLLGLPGWISFFYWTGLAGGFLALLGSVVALVRRFTVPEVRAMSQPDDYLVHLFLIPILGLGLYQVLAHRIFGLAYTASAWFASVVRLSPQPELMASASPITKWHVFLALTFFAYFPFTKLVHFWTYPVNYLVRPYQSMRSARRHFRRRWELAFRSDQSWMLAAMVALALLFAGAGMLLGRAAAPVAKAMGAGSDADRASGERVATEADAPAIALAASRVTTGSAPALTGWPLYVSQCARCHGISGRGDGPGADSPTFASPPRDLVAGHFRFVTTANGVASDADLERALREGLPGSGMLAFDRLSDVQLRSLVAVLDALWEDRPAPGPAVEVPPRPPLAETLLERGRTLYVRTCAMCHGETGRGDGPAAGSLVDWRGRPVRPADLTDGQLKGGREPEALFRRIVVGVPGGPEGARLMPGQPELAPADVWAIVEFLESEILP